MAKEKPLHEQGERKQTTLRFSDELYEALKGIATEMGLNVTTVLLIGIWSSVLKQALKLH
jgi:hypothetical protein